jgi:hypothetical protein
VLRVREVRAFAATLEKDEFGQQVGPFVLIRRPPEVQLQRAAMQHTAETTIIGSHKKASLMRELLLMVRHFDDLAVCALPPVADGSEIIVGRGSECDLVLDDPSVTKRHAVLRWDTARRQCAVEDLGSTNGTFVNSEPIERGQKIKLSDGDSVTFGDAEFLYFLSDSFYAQLASGGLTA